MRSTGNLSSTNIIIVTFIYNASHSNQDNIALQVYRENKNSTKHDLTMCDKAILLIVYKLKYNLDWHDK